MLIHALEISTDKVEVVQKKKHGIPPF